jgi:hypothetical protein
LYSFHFLYVPTHGLPVSLPEFVTNALFLHVHTESLNSANDAPTILAEASHLPSSLTGNAVAQNAQTSSEIQSQTTSGPQQVLDDEADVDVDPDVELDVELEASLPPVSPLSVLSNLSATSPTGAGEDSLLLCL